MLKDKHSVNAWFEELDYRRTPMGELILQRRCVAALNNAEVYEVKLGGEYLMSSLFHEAETALADTCLGALDDGHWDIVVGGLGLGYTAAAALRFPQVQRMIIIEALQPVIDWHINGLAPNGRTLTGDPRCVYRCADFFALARETGFDSEAENQLFDAVLLDIDHTPSNLLSPKHADFYTEQGLRRMKRFLKSGGVFGVWSNDPPEEAFQRRMEAVFIKTCANVLTFPNPFLDRNSSNTIYIARNV